MAKKLKEGNALAELLEAAPHKVLSKLITELTVMFPDVRRECFDFLKSQPRVSKGLAKRSEGEAVLALWSELAPDLEDLDMHGGGDYGIEDDVAELLDQIRERLESKEVDADYRRELLDLVLPLIKSGNAGMDDMLDDVANAARSPLTAACWANSAIARITPSSRQSCPKTTFAPEKSRYCAMRMVMRLIWCSS